MSASLYPLASSALVRRWQQPSSSSSSPLQTILQELPGTDGDCCSCRGFLMSPSGSGVGEHEDRPPLQPLFLKFLLLAPPVHFALLSVGTRRIFSFGVVGATEPSLPSLDLCRFIKFGTLESEVCKRVWLRLELLKQSELWLHSRN